MKKITFTKELHLVNYSYRRWKKLQWYKRRTEEEEQRRRWREYQQGGGVFTSKIMRWDPDQRCTQRYHWLRIHDMATKIIYFTVNGRPEQAEFPVDCPAQDVKGRSRPCFIFRLQWFLYVYVNKCSLSSARIYSSTCAKCFQTNIIWFLIFIKYICQTW